MNKFLLSFWVLVLFVFSNITTGQILTFEFSALAGNEVSANSNSNDANLNSSTISRGAGLTASGNGGRFNATSWALTSIANAVSGNDYMEFTITPNSGYQFSVSSIVVQWQRSASGNTAISLRSSVDGYATDLDAVKLVTDGTATQTFTWTFAQSNSTSAVTYRLYSYAESVDGSGGPGDGAGNDIVVNGTVTSSGAPTPLITVTPSTLTDFTYVQGAGPSIQQTFTISGSNLTSNISVVAPTNYEISKTSGSGYTSPLTFTQSGGTVTEQTVYVRLKSGLNAGNYNAETVTATSTDATDKTVTCSGTVYKPEPTNHVTNFSVLTGNPSSSIINITWTDASGGTVPDGYLIKGSSVSYDDIATPADFTAELDAGLVKNITQGTGSYTFVGLSENTHYYFKIFPYTNSGANINYKTTAAPQGDATTTVFTGLFLEENFSYTAGTSLTANGWSAHSSGGTQPITVNSGGLTYAGYPSSGIGNAALVDNTGEDVNRTFSEVTSGSVYASFLVNVTTIPPAGYFLNLGSSSIGTTFRGKVFIQNSGGLQFGLSKGSNTGIFSSNVYSTGNTYLLVLKYTIVAGVDNDNVSLYVFGGSDDYSVEPGTPTIGPLSDAAISDINPGSIALRQYDATQNILIDGIRVADRWSEAPLPVELTSFTAKFIGGKVSLNWATATEVNNYGFEIERSLSSQSSSLNGHSLSNEWKKVGFVAGSGNSNSVKEYSFTDSKLSTGKLAYRLKQIDNDGTISFSKIVEVENLRPSTFDLRQNYPNPFNPSTVISYQLPVSAQVSLKVYDVLGNEVASLVNLQQEAGSYNVTLDASTLASGTYIYRLIAGDYVAVKKMAVLK